MRTIFLLLLIGYFFLYSLKSNVAALYTYWWFAIFRPHEWAWESTLNNLHLTKIAALLFLAQSIINKKIPRVDNSISLLMIALIFFEFVANSLNGCSDVYTVRTSTIYDLSILLIIVLLTTETLEKRFIIFWLITVIGLSLGFHSGKGGIYALISGGDNYGASNLTGLFSGSNAYALGTGMLIFFMIFSMQLINNDSLKIKNNFPIFFLKNVPSKFFLLYKIILLLTIFGSIYNIISLQSRGSFIATFLGLMLWILLHEKRKILFFISLLGISLSLILLPLPENFADRISSAFAEKEDLDKSAASRPYFWNIAFEISKDHPLGVGPGCYPAYYNNYDATDGYYGRFRSVHSSHFQILSDIGYLGVFAWFSLFYISYKILWRIRRTSKKYLSTDDNMRFYFYLSNTLICSMTVFLIGGSFYEYAYNDITWLTWGFVIATDRLFRSDFEARKNRTANDSL
jgi:O-antigen ligase